MLLSCFSYYETPRAIDQLVWSRHRKGLLFLFASIETALRLLLEFRIATGMLVVSRGSIGGLQTHDGRPGHSGSLRSTDTDLQSPLLSLVPTSPMMRCMHSIMAKPARRARPIFVPSIAVPSAHGRGRCAGLLIYISYPSLLYVAVSLSARLYLLADDKRGRRVTPPWLMAIAAT